MPQQSYFSPQKSCLDSQRQDFCFLFLQSILSLILIYPNKISSHFFFYLTFAFHNVHNFSLFLNHYFVCVQGLGDGEGTASSVQGLLLVLHQELLLRVPQWPYGMPGIELKSVACKASILPTVISLHLIFLNLLNKFFLPFSRYKQKIATYLKAHHWKTIKNSFY